MDLIKVIEVFEYSSEEREVWLNPNNINMVRQAGEITLVKMKGSEIPLRIKGKIPFIDDPPKRVTK